MNDQFEDFEFYIDWSLVQADKFIYLKNSSRIAIVK